MKKEELVQGMQMLGLAYNKEFSPEECELYYEFLQEYNFETFKTAIKNIIKTSPFAPKINDLITACDNAKTIVRYDVLEYMRKIGYFKTPGEYEKATSFMEKGIVPKWLQDDINKYYKQMVNNRLDHKDTLMIGG